MRRARTHRVVIVTAAGLAALWSLSPIYGQSARPPQTSPPWLEGDGAGALRTLTPELRERALNELLQKVAAYARVVPLEDVNNDASIAVEDARLQLRAIVRGFAGDLDGSGVVDVGDVAIVIRAMSEGLAAPTSADGDLNADGRIDIGDVTLVMRSYGQEIDSALVDELVDQMLPAASSNNPTDHARYFSEGNPPYWPGWWPLQQPPQWPPNHEYSISKTWYQKPPYGPPTPHTYVFSRNLWPPNHYWSITTLWPEQHQQRSSLQDWPPNHLASVSENWPGPGDHSTTVSDQWPPNHLKANSRRESHLQIWSILHPDDPHMIPDPSPHVHEISMHWADHQVRQSLWVWPPNHIRQASLTWRYDHILNLSLTWPQGHFGGMSRAWPTPTPPWPPNHIVSVSERDGEPHAPPVPPLFPEDHTIFKTIKELIPKVPKEEKPDAQPAAPANPSQQ
jgi:hypothetical protein